MADEYGTSGYLQLHKLGTKARQGSTKQSFLKDATFSKNGMESYIAHLERQLSRASSSEEGAAFKQAQAIMKQLEKRIEECFGLIQGTQSFCEELARDSHARFEDAQSRIKRCERACRTAYSSAFHPDRVEALVREETLSLEKRLLQAVDDRCRMLQNAVLNAAQSSKSCSSFERGSSDETWEEAEHLHGMQTMKACKYCAYEAGSSKRSQDGKGRRRRQSHDTKRVLFAEEKPGVKLPQSRDSPKCQERCSEEDVKAEVKLEQVIKESMKVALAQIAEAGRTAVEKVAKAERGDDEAERGPSSGEENRPAKPPSQSEVQSFSGCVSRAEEKRTEGDMTTKLTDDVLKEASEQLAQLNKAVSALQSDTSDLKRANLAQESKDEKLIERFSSLEGGIQQLEDSSRGTREDIGRLSATGRAETEALSAKHKQVSVALSKHVDVVASLQARVNDIATCLLDVKGGRRVEAPVDVRERRPEDKRMVNGHEEKRAAIESEESDLKVLRDVDAPSERKESQLAMGSLKSVGCSLEARTRGDGKRGLEELRLSDYSDAPNCHAEQPDSGLQNGTSRPRGVFLSESDREFPHPPFEEGGRSFSKETLLAKFLSATGTERFSVGSGTLQGHVSSSEWRDEGSAYSRALAMTEERKRRLDKLYRELASTPTVSSPFNWRQSVETF